MCLRGWGGCLQSQLNQDPEPVQAVWGGVRCEWGAGVRQQTAIPPRRLFTQTCVRTQAHLCNLYRTRAHYSTTHAPHQTHTHTHTHTHIPSLQAEGFVYGWYYPAMKAWEHYVPFMVKDKDDVLEVGSVTAWLGSWLGSAASLLPCTLRYESEAQTDGKVIPLYVLTAPMPARCNSCVRWPLALAALGLAPTPFTLAVLGTHNPAPCCHLCR